MKTIKFSLLFCLVPFFLQAQDPDAKPWIKPLSSYMNPTVAFDNFNNYGVFNNPSAPTSFTLGASYLLVSIQTYHWNNARGANPGTIKLVHANGTVYGPWVATGIPGSWGVKNAFWTVSPNVQLPAGTYTVVDSDNATWSCNSQSKNKGFTKVIVK